MISAQRRADIDSEDVSATAQRDLVEHVRRSPGKPLDEPVRAEWEARYNTDLSDVRVHTDSTAHKAALSVQAVAFTTGSDIAFQHNTYQPDTPAGRKLLGHEIAHIGQQQAGSVAGTDTGAGVLLSHPSDDFEKAADDAADRALAQPLPLQLMAAESADSGAAPEHVSGHTHDDDAYS